VSARTNETEQTKLGQTHDCAGDDKATQERAEIAERQLLKTKKPESRHVAKQRRFEKETQGKKLFVATIRRGNRSARMSGRIAVARNQIAMNKTFTQCRAD
jgi:hypothetical protein